MTGPFSFSRHPMYLGMVLVLVGLALFLGSAVTLMFPVIFAVLMEAVFIPAEEENMERAFGKRYDEYRKNVRKWI